MTTLEALEKVKNYVEKMEALTPASRQQAISKQENLEFAKAIMSGLEELDKLRAWREPTKALNVDTDERTCDCPKCNSTLYSEYDVTDIKFCLECGQALKFGG